jgi:hypothetical protein
VKRDGMARYVHSRPGFSELAETYRTLVEQGEAGLLDEDEVERRLEPVRKRLLELRRACRGATPKPASQRRARERQRARARAHGA